MSCHASPSSTNSSQETASPSSQNFVINRLLNDAHSNGDDVSKTPSHGDLDIAGNDCPSFREFYVAEEEKRRREKLTLEDCVDMDVDVLTTVLERSFQSLKRETLDFFIEARARFKTRALHERDQERHCFERKEEAKKGELRLLEEELRDERKRNERLVASLSRTATAVGSAHQRKRAYRLMLTMCQAWMIFAKSERALKSKMQKALRFYCGEYLTRRTFTRWLESMREHHRSCARERFQAKLAVAREALEMEFKEKLAVVEEENAKLKEKLKAESDTRSKLEEDMQQAFMRGVCALNMEALSVMKRGMPPSGLNPFLNATSDTCCELQTQEGEAL